MFDPAAQGLAGLQMTQVLRGDVDDVVERGGQVEPARDVRRDDLLWVTDMTALGYRYYCIGVQILLRKLTEPYP